MPNNLPYDDSDSRSIEAYAQRLVDRNLRSFLSAQEVQDILFNSSQGNKGSFGHLIEEYYFRIKPNSRPISDFSKANVELKTVPLKQSSQNKYLIPKERLVLGIINYRDIIKESWVTSSFLKKNLNLLLIFYLFIKEELPIDHLIKLARLWKFPESDLRIIKDDWELIVNKIKAKKAHELSEGDTFYLGACTKGATAASSYREQVGSSVKAKQRAFSLKVKYLKVVLESLQGRYRDAEPIVRSLNELEGRKGLDELIVRKFDRYIGKSIDDIERMVPFKLNRDSKDYPAALARAMLGISKRKIEEFDKADVIMKVVRLKKDGMPKESMSFKAFRYEDIIKEEWDESTLREMMSKKFFFVIFRYREDGALILERVMFWNIPHRDLESEVKKCWEETVRRIKNKQAENLPKMSENKICHVRPHGTKGETFPTHYGKDVKKQSFWLNARYLKDQIAGYSVKS